VLKVLNLQELSLKHLRSRLCRLLRATVLSFPLQAFQSPIFLLERILALSDGIKVSQLLKASLLHHLKVRGGSALKNV